MRTAIRSSITLLSSSITNNPSQLLLRRHGNNMTTSSTNITAGDKLESLRKHLQSSNIDAYLVPSDDPHLSEYTPDAYKRRAFLTNFHGSAGTALVTHDRALLWTDSRYFNEAKMSLDSQHWVLMKSGQPKVPTLIEWLKEEASKHYTATEMPLRIGMDPYVHAASFAKECKEAFHKVEEHVTGELVTLNSPNLVDVIWGDARPPIPTSPFRVHPLEYAGMSLQQKVKRIRKEMKEKKATLSVFCTLDDVAYLLNVRATGDVECCPVGIAYATVSNEEVTLYCDERKIDDVVREHLKDVAIKPYDAIVDDVEGHLQSEKSKVWIDCGNANMAIVSIIPERALINSQNAVLPMKACKNRAEMEGMRRAHVVDGVAMAEFMAWLEHTVVEEGKSVTEVEIHERLTAYRAAQPGFIEVSFPTIAGVGSNGAIVHYSAQEGTDLLKSLDTTQPVLIDSGGQYVYGTTDVTRTWHFGEPTDEFKTFYTRVLKGNICVDQMFFPENTPGFVLDAFARKALWDICKDYGHGTGHGVGAALNVHEGPISITPRWGNKEVLKKGMVVSNEPGYYKDGSFGCRIENLLEITHVNPDDNQESNDKNDEQKDKVFLKFEKLTLIPIQTNLIDNSIMTEEEMNWVDDYHQEVFRKLSPLLENGSSALNWLRKSCQPIDRSNKS